MKKFLQIIRLIILIILFIILLDVIYLKFIKKQDFISIFGKSFFIISSGSMEPIINIEDLIVVSKCESYTVGDVVTYKDSEGTFITHRIVEIDEKNFISRGDANNINDPEQSISNIKGKVIFSSNLIRQICFILV